jgi:hypothetical protein
MGWVHRHKHSGAVLALIALALQIAVGFSHVHLHGLGGNSHAPIAKLTRLAHTPPQTPAQTPTDDDDYCAICASIFLASSAFAPAPPQLLVPVNFERVELCFDTASPLAEPPRLAFRSRAPPVA